MQLSVGEIVYYYPMTNGGRKDFLKYRAKIVQTFPKTKRVFIELLDGQKNRKVVQDRFIERIEQ